MTMFSKGHFKSLSKQLWILQYGTHGILYQNSTSLLETGTQAKLELIDSGTHSVLLFLYDFANSVHITWDAETKTNLILSALYYNVFLLGLTLQEIISLGTPFGTLQVLVSHRYLCIVTFKSSLNIRALSVFIRLNLFTLWSKPLALKFDSTLTSIGELTKTLRPESHWWRH